MPRRRSDQAGAIIWPGFVDAMTGLLLVVMFVLSIFMIVQFVLREELIGKDKSLASLGAQLSLLQEELGSERRRTQEAEGRVASLEELLAREEERARDLGRQLAASREENVTLSAELEKRIAELAVTAEALKDLQGRSDRLLAVEERNAELEKTQLTLEERLSALELQLDKKRAEAEETLKLLAAAEAKGRQLDQAAIDAAQKLSQRELLNAFAEAALAEEKEVNAENRKAIALLNSQIRDLRGQIAALELQLRVTEEKEAEAQVEIKSLGERLNKALARKVDELQRTQSIFLQRLSELLAGREGVQVVGDRFVFQSEVLFASGSAELGEAGKRELAKFAGVLREISPEFPPDLAWILRVDGHTDVVPIGANSEYSSNWELSQARALSVVQYLVRAERIPPERLVAAGFGQYHPLDPARSAEAFKKNRRIELKLTTR